MARSKGHTGRPWRRIRAQVLATSNVCHLCGLPGATSVDHVIPIARGGPPLDPANLRPAHIKCNSSKGARLHKQAPNNTSREW